MCNVPNIHLFLCHARERSSGGALERFAEQSTSLILDLSMLLWGYIELAMCVGNMSSDRIRSRLQYISFTKPTYYCTCTHIALLLEPSSRMQRIYSMLLMHRSLQWNKCAGPALELRDGVSALRVHRARTSVAISEALTPMS